MQLHEFGAVGQAAAGEGNEVGLALGCRRRWRAARGHPLQRFGLVRSRQRVVSVQPGLHRIGLTAPFEVGHGIHHEAIIAVPSGVSMQIPAPLPRSGRSRP